MSNQSSICRYIKMCVPISSVPSFVFSHNALVITQESLKYSD